MAVLLAANVGFIPTPLHLANPELSAVRWGAEELNDRLDSYGYGGLELHWSNVFKHCREMRAASPDEARILARGVESAHESWRGVANPVPFDQGEMPRRTDVPPDSLVFTLGSMVLVPTGAGSLNALEKLERKLGRPEPLHYVMFPDARGDYMADHKKTARFPNSSIQPTVDLEACWNARTPRQFVEELILRGYKATLDSFHISRKGKIVQAESANWKGLAGRLLEEKMVHEVHVSVGRSDFAAVDPKRYKQSVAELRALIQNKSLEGTPLGDLAELLKQHQWTGNVVIEATIPGLSKAYKKQMTPKLLAELHSGLTAGVKELLPHITWESKLTREAVT